MIRVMFGRCMDCHRKFWWTGEKKAVPNCGGCGRKHDEDDFRLAKTPIKPEPTLAEKVFKSLLDTIFK